ncbi:hypothetical protein [Aeromonas diversa]
MDSSSYAPAAGAGRLTARISNAFSRHAHWGGVPFNDQPLVYSGRV